MSLTGVERLAVHELCTFSIDFAEFQIFPTTSGLRLVAVVAGGRVAGPRLDGEILPGGGDWLVVGADGVARMDVRATIRAAGGQIVYVTGSGRTELLDGARDRFAAGDTVTERDGEVRSRLALLFETGEGDHRWLNATLAIGLVRELSQRHIRYEVYGVA